MEPVRIGVIGCGVMGARHAAGAQQLEETAAVAVCDVRGDLAKEVAEKNGIDRAYTDANELIHDPEVEAVVLAMPAFVRTELALKAFAAGKHVLTEKPVAMNAGEVEQMLQAQGNLVGACCSSRVRCFESAEVATRFLAEGRLGDLRLVRIRAIIRARPRPEKIPPEWRLKKTLNGGGILLNWGCYDLDYMLGIAGWTLEPETVFAQTWPVPPIYEAHVAAGSDAETYFAALTRCKGGTVISFERGEYMPAEQDTAWQFLGSEGSLRLTMYGRGRQQLLHDRGSAEDGVITQVLWEGDDDHSGGGILGPQRDFARCVREGGRPMTSLDNALTIQKISDAIYRSAETGKSVDVG